MTAGQRLIELGRQQGIQQGIQQGTSKASRECSCVSCGSASAMR